MLVFPDLHLQPVPRPVADEGHLVAPDLPASRIERQQFDFDRSAFIVLSAVGDVERSGRYRQVKSNVEGLARELALHQGLNRPLPGMRRLARDSRRRVGAAGDDLHAFPGIGRQSGPGTRW